jgi:hypothetical protein
VADYHRSITYLDAKTRRPVDIRTLGGGWPNVFESFLRKAEHSQILQTWSYSSESKPGKVALPYEIVNSISVCHHRPHMILGS